MRISMPFALLLVTGCATTPSAVPVAESQSEPQPETVEIAAAVHWMRNSAEYRALMLQTYAVASERLRELAKGREPGSWAIASDADETILDNSPYARELILSGQQTSDERWDAWVARRAAPPLPGAVAFLELVHELGGYVAIVTNRKAEHCGDTRANFRAFDIPFDVILCREDDRRKEGRWQRVEAGTTRTDLPPLEILLWVGDNIEDFPSLDQSVRLENDARFADFAERFFVVPNPTYGSWMENPKD
jgi:5'-nucleotidase (lipoprotein e(P4) family)